MSNDNNKRYATSGDLVCVVILVVISWWCGYSVGTDKSVTVNVNEPAVVVQPEQDQADE